MNWLTRWLWQVITGAPGGAAAPLALEGVYDTAVAMTGQYQATLGWDAEHETDLALEGRW